MSTHISYVDLHKVLFSKCVGKPRFLRDSDFGHLTLNTFAEPPAWIQSSSRLNDYGAYNDIPLALHRRPGDDMTLLLPFNNHIGTSIWIWQPTWDANQQFSVRIAKPVRDGDRLKYPNRETALLHNSSQQVLWRKICLVSRIKSLVNSSSKWPRTSFYIFWNSVCLADVKSASFLSASQLDELLLKNLYYSQLW